MANQRSQPAPGQCRISACTFGHCYTQRPGLRCAACGQAQATGQAPHVAAAAAAPSQSLGTLLHCLQEVSHPTVRPTRREVAGCHTASMQLPRSTTWPLSVSGHPKPKLVSCIVNGTSIGQPQLTRRHVMSSVCPVAVQAAAGGQQVHVAGMEMVGMESGKRANNTCTCTGMLPPGSPLHQPHPPNITLTSGGTYYFPISPVR